MPVPPDSPDPHYYLRNFQRALAWVEERYDDLLDGAERTFLQAFGRLPLASQALLVRMLMRKGPLFRATRLAYTEIGCPLEAAQPLVEQGLVDSAPLLTLDELFELSTRPELGLMFSDVAGKSGLRKADLLARVREGLHEGLLETLPEGMPERHSEARRFEEWAPHTKDRVLRVTVTALCDRLRLMFFGNLHQDWSEFVLADLGVFQYETVAFAPSSRAFQQRKDVDVYLALHACREALEKWPSGPVGEPLDALLSAADACRSANPWLETRRAKLLFRIGQHCERQHDWPAAVAVYERCHWPGARHRRIRVHERSGDFAQALALAQMALDAPESEEESQRVVRMLPRLQKRLGQVPVKAARPQAIARSVLTLPRPGQPFAVEAVARDHLSTVDAPVYYVENGLINSLFGLLCWEPVFAALPGAFFHPFQRGPADLHAPDFHARRAAQFAACLDQLDGAEYRQTILRHFETKSGLQSPFVFW
ncbi:MAG TPA: VRR-NUC domain-containing protein, partial [Paraburkholderia sp.]|nr:VRR-NUC domain-containing protein [Paraburkholderia sp.]